MSISQFLVSRFSYHTYMEGPIVAILAAYTALFSAIAVFALARLNFQRR